MTTLSIGIDNGISGALAAVSPHSQIVSVLPMPIQKARKGNEIDVQAVWNWLDGLGRNKITVTIEEPGGSKSAKAATSMAGSFHALRTICVLKGIRWHRVTPQAWQKDMLPGCKAGETKARALALARQLWPSGGFLASKRCHVAHDGIVDSLLIAEWSRRKNL
jgi:hypothetical protein